MLKDAILSGLEGMGCKGIALANALRALDLRRGSGGAALGLLGATRLPSGAAILPVGDARHERVRMSGLHKVPSAPGLGAMPAGLAGAMGGAVPADVAAKMAALMPGAGQLPAGLGLDPIRWRCWPVSGSRWPSRCRRRRRSPPSTSSPISGFLPKPIQSELKECMVVLPTTLAALGMGMAMIKPIVPKLRQAPRRAARAVAGGAGRGRSRARRGDPPLPAEQRAEFVEHLGSGFFPPRIVAGVKERLGGR